MLRLYTRSYRWSLVFRFGKAKNELASNEAFWGYPKSLGRLGFGQFLGRLSLSKPYKNSAHTRSSFPTHYMNSEINFKLFQSWSEILSSSLVVLWAVYFQSSSLAIGNQYTSCQLIINTHRTWTQRLSFTMVCVNVDRSIDKAPLIVVRLQRQLTSSFSLLSRVAHWSWPHTVWLSVCKVCPATRLG